MDSRYSPLRNRNLSNRATQATRMALLNQHQQKVSSSSTFSAIPSIHRSASKYWHPPTHLSPHSLASLTTLTSKAANTLRSKISPRSSQQPKQNLRRGRTRPREP